MVWLPILHGERSARAEQLILTIAEQTSVADFEHEPTGVASGSLGSALLLAYVAKAWPSANSHRRAALSLRDSLNTPQHARLLTDPGLFTGFPGLMWLVAHLPWLTGDDTKQVLEQAERAVLSALAEPWQRSFCYAEGLIGLGVFLLERPESEQNNLALGRIVQHLRSLSQQIGAGVSWLRSRESFPYGARPATDVYDLGVPRGVAGAIAFLARATLRPSLRAISEPLLRSAVSWFEQQQSAAHAWGRYGAHFAPGDAAPPATRLGWCYGDLGISLVLLGAARALGDVQLEQRAIELAALSSLRSGVDTEIEDAGFCHGAAGAGHLYARLYAATGDQRFMRVAQRWFDVALAMHPGDDGQFSAFYSSAESLEFQRRARPGLLMGNAGIALCFLSACRAVAPDWDRYFLL